MSHHALIEISFEAAPVPAQSDKSRAKGEAMDDFETGAFSFLHPTREARIQFAPHRLVGNYADYRRLAASKFRMLG